MKRYFITYTSNTNGIIRQHSTEVSIHKGFNIKEISKVLEENGKYPKIVITFFKEFKRNEKYGN